MPNEAEIACHGPEVPAKRDLGRAQRFGHLGDRDHAFRANAFRDPPPALQRQHRLRMLTDRSNSIKLGHPGPSAVDKCDRSCIFRATINWALTD